MMMTLIGLVLVGSFVKVIYWALLTGEDRCTWRNGIMWFSFNLHNLLLWVSLTG